MKDKRRFSQVTFYLLTRLQAQHVRYLKIDRVNDWSPSGFPLSIKIYKTPRNRSHKYKESALPSPNAALILVSTKNRGLSEGPRTEKGLEVCDSRTSHLSAHGQSQVRQIWLVEYTKRVLCAWSENWTFPEFMILGADQKVHSLWGWECGTALRDERKNLHNFLVLAIETKLCCSRYPAVHGVKLKMKLFLLQFLYFTLY